MRTRTQAADALQSDIQARNHDIETLKEGDGGIKGLSITIDQLKQDINRITKERDDQLTAVQEAITQRNALNAELNTLNQQQFTLNREHEHALREVNHKLDQRNGEIRSLKDNLADSKEHTEQLTNDLGRIASDKQAVERDSQQLKSQLDQTQQERDKLTSQKEGLSKEVSQLKASLDVLKVSSSGEQEALLAKQQTMTEQLVRVSTELSENKKAYETVKNEFDAAQARLSSLESDLSTERESARQVIQQTEQQLRRAEKNLDDKQQQLTTLMQEKTTVGKALEASKVEVALLNETVGQIAHQLEGREASLLQTVEALRKAEERVKENETEIQSLTHLEQATREQLQKKERACDALSQQLETEKAQFATAVVERDKAREETAIWQQYRQRTAPLVSDSGQSSNDSKAPGLDTFLKALKGISPDQVSTIARQGSSDQMVHALIRAALDCEARLRDIEQSSKDDSYDHNDLPSQSNKRQSMIQALNHCREKVNAVVKQYCPDQPDPVIYERVIGQRLAALETIVGLYQAEETVFSDFRETVEAFAIELDNSELLPNELVTRGLLQIQSLQYKVSSMPIEAELNGYSAARILLSISMVLKQQTDQLVS